MVLLKKWLQIDHLRYCLSLLFFIFLVIDSTSRTTHLLRLYPRIDPFFGIFIRMKRYSDRPWNIDRNRWSEEAIFGEYGGCDRQWCEFWIACSNYYEEGTDGYMCKYTQTWTHHSVCIFLYYILFTLVTVLQATWNSHPMIGSLLVKLSLTGFATCGRVLSCWKITLSCLFM